jgi:NAD(P)-dependent dehydrogenase (short-subunit alcohol dehydrogenase family)|tara:strand:+ start:7221 stop:8045 length:825 start_codon:yes stop_codon:yes gene_type:complete
MDSKTIFVTGAASGMGRSTAKLFRRHGWFVGAFDVNETGLQSLEEELAGNCQIGFLDVTDKDAFDRAMAGFAEVTGGRLDLMYNNAGIGVAGWFDETPFDKIMDVVKVNFIGVLNGIHTAIPLLKETPGSLCFTTSSSAATFGAPGLAVYAATKHAVKGLTEALSVELARFGVRAADVLPGLIDTPILRDTPRYLNGELVEVDGPTIGANAPNEGMFRMIPPEEVAECVWEAYHSNKLHWYVPPEIVEIDNAKAVSPEALRDARITASGFKVIE